jgi:methionyl-tRNA formyltransferase
VLDDVDFVDFDQADVGFSVVGTRIFKPHEIAAVPFGIINLHLAPLPKYRGRYSFTHAIVAGDTRFGVTLHYIDEGMDTGPVIAERIFSIKPTDTAWALYLRAQREGTALFRETAPRIISYARCGYKVWSHPQDESKAQYFNRFSLPESAENPRALAWR